MLSYIANINTSKIIQKVCKRKNILILNTQEIETDIKQYIKETKVNFNLIKYLVIDISNLNNSETDIIESIYNFSKLYIKTKIIILALGYDNQNVVLINLYDLGFYNIINESEESLIEEKLDSMPSNNVYLFSLLLEAVTRLVKFICYIVIFGLTSIGLTILLNSELRKMVFQIFGLK